MKKIRPFYFLFLLVLLLFFSDFFAAVLKPPRPEMIPILKPGEKAIFIMGDNSDFGDCYSGPAHKVVLTVPYMMCKYETRNDQFCEVMN
jgi:hypothetical protein